MSVKNSDEMVLSRPSTKVSNPPGGKSSISFGWSNDEPAPEKRPEPKAQPQVAPSQPAQQAQPAHAHKSEPKPEPEPAQTQPNGQQAYQSHAKTSVKMSHPPGGASSIVFG